MRPLTWGLVLIAWASTVGIAAGQVVTYSSAVLADNPVAYYRFSESTGTTAANSANVAGAIEGTYTNGVQLDQPTLAGLTPAPLRSAGFDGVSSNHVAVTNIVGPGANQLNALNFTLETWIRTTATSLTGTQAYQGNGLIWSDVGGVNNDFVLAVLNDRISFFNGNPDRSINGNTLLNDGNWHHIVAVREVTGGNSVMSVFVDGVSDATPLVGTGTQALTINPNMAIGGNTLDGRFFNGLMDEVALYNTALSPARISAHFVTAVPEPSTLALVSLTAFSALVVRRIRAARVARPIPSVSGDV